MVWETCREALRTSFARCAVLKLEAPIPHTDGGFAETVRQSRKEGGAIADTLGGARYPYSPEMMPARRRIV